MATTDEAEVEKTILPITEEEEGWVSVMGDGIKIKSIKRGEGDAADMNTIVSCNLTGYYSDDRDHEKVLILMYVIQQSPMFLQLDPLTTDNRNTDIYQRRTLFTLTIDNRIIHRSHYSEYILESILSSTYLIT